jgi:hypothetical protein
VAQIIDLPAVLTEKIMVITAEKRRKSAMIYKGNN